MSFYENFLSETHKMFRQTAKRFALDEIRPNAHAWEEAGEFPRDLYKKAADAGILGVGFPEELGGSGGGPMAGVMVIEGLMHGGSTGVAAGLGSLGIGLPPVVQSEDERLIDEFARPALAGDKICGLAITEPNTGSDVAGVTTRAELDGDEYVVSGAKMFITSGVRADFLTTLVRTAEDKHGGLSFLVVETDREGVTLSEPLAKHGWWASDTAEIGFDEVRVPKENLVGSEGGGFVTLMRNFQNERLALAAYGVATAELAYEESMKYVKEREAFGRPIVGFQVTRHKLVDMHTRITAAKTFLYQVASRMEAGEYIVKEVSMAKNIAAELAVDVCYEAVQLHGGMGYMRESLVERLSRDARLLPIGGGTQEIMKEIIAKQMGI
ncbi:acyl-CoA dehydrogenase [Persicimonas caeni]|uniref:Acyl-CoA dehydrogenase n=1 Tax=Persicimonas caeni TaxID=2292766 RepID=A0A4Y6PML2_PERCE|nr:acyl-CoA dehydrogenase family protein [Persicimonas caeni]QDG49453.1 acyl-CoA dehydrogenase [Persicimonas caeni]QED30674.1 acyl-CoA dehydrogenase [Persicimonas caeni]